MYVLCGSCKTDSSCWLVRGSYSHSGSFSHETRFIASDDFWGYVGGIPFAPSLNDSFDILTAINIAGEFRNVTLPALSWQYNWQLDYLANGVTLTVISTGDFNDDGAVDAADYVVWRKTSGSPDVYNTWRTDFGQPVGDGVSSSADRTVPEPATALLIILAVVCVSTRRR